MTDDLAAALAGIRERFKTVTGIPLEALPLEPEQAAAFAALGAGCGRDAEAPGG